MAQNYVAMVVNNNAMERNSIIGVLKRDFNVHNVLSAQNAKDALATLRQEQPVDWIFLDYELPDGDGLLFVDEAKKMPKTERSAFILTSTKSDKAMLLRAAASGVNEFLLKPFSPNTLISKIRRVVESADRRTTDRHAPEKEIATIFSINDTQYKGKLLDISLGGCMVRCELFKKGGMIYDKGKLALVIGAQNEPVNVDVEVVRLERNPEYDADRETFRVAFRFLKASEADLTRLRNFITSLNQGKK